MNYYFFTYKRFFIKKKIKAVGHKYIENMDRMDVFLTNGGVYSISQWAKYDLKLGSDWVLFTKNQMEKESGQKLNLDL